MKKSVIFAAVAAILFVIVGCPQPTDPVKPEPHIWQVSLNWDEVTIFHARDVDAERYKMEMTLTNTGNQRMEDIVIGVITENALDFGVDKISINSLEPGDSETFIVTFPFMDVAKMYDGMLLAGNQRAGARVQLRYGVYELINDPLFTSDPPLLQLGVTDSVVFNTTDTENTGIWIASAGALKEGGILVLPEKAGVIHVGFLVSEAPFNIKGRRLTVYPAMQKLDMFYTGQGADLIRSNNGSAMPLNLLEIQNKVGENQSLRFSLENNGGGIVSFIHPSTGEITIRGDDGDSGIVTVVAEITQTVPEGVLTVFRGSAAFNVIIGVSPPPVLLDAETVNTVTDIQTFRINLNFDQAVNAGSHDARDGFTIVKAPSTVLAIQQAVIVNNVIQFTLGGASPVVLGDVLTLSYNKTQGGIQNAGNTALDDIADFPITNKLEEQEPGPAMVSATINGSNRSDANKLVISYDKAAHLTNASGFSIGNTTGSGIGFTAFTAEPDNLSVILTLSRLPMWSEAEADNLTLTYNAAVGTVNDGEGRFGVSGTIPITLQYFTAADYEPPSVSSVTLDGNVQTSLAIEWSKDVAGGFGGFALTGASPAITFTASSISGPIQTLTMSRAPAPGELANLRLSYDAGVGNLSDATSNRAESFANKEVAVVNGDMFVSPPLPVSAAINAANPVSLVLTFDSDVSLTASAGFSVSGSATATALTAAVSGSGTSSITFTLNRKPAYGETLLLSYNGTGNAQHNDNSAVRVAAFTDQSVTLNGFTAANDSRPVLETVIVDANRDGTGASFEQAKKIYLAFDKAVTALNINGFTLSGSSTATQITGISGSGTNTLALSLNSAASESEIAAVILSYDMNLGNLADANDNIVLGFGRNIQFLNYGGMGENADTERPSLIRATVENSTPSILQVVFSEPVSIDRTKFVVKVNTVPRWASASTGAINEIPMDNGASIRTITNASPVGTTPSTTWNFTMSSPAQFGEILRLATATATDGSRASDIAYNAHLAGAAIDVSGNELLAVRQFIIRTLVERTRGAFESVPGLYRNGVLVASVTDGEGGDMYRQAISHLSSAGNYMQDGEIITLVLPGNQTYNGGDSFNATHLPSNDARRNNPPMFIITTPFGNTQERTITITGDGFGLVMRNAGTVVLDDNVVITRSVSSQRPLVALMDGGKMILNGGALRGNRLNVNTSFDSGGHRGGAIRVQGGSFGAYLIVNRGDISGNEVVETSGTAGSTNGGAGAVYMMQYGVTVIHGGSITNNSYHDTNTGSSGARAGAISDDGGGRSSQHHANSAFFMTGGEIGGNSVSGSTNGPAAGGVLVSGTFQKVGGTIYGEDAADAAMRNTNAMTGNNNVRVGAAAVIMAAVGNPAIAGTSPGAKLRDTTAGSPITLFVESSKTSNGSAGNNTVPDWAESFWDN